MEKGVERKEKERIWPPEKMHLCCNTIASTRIMPNFNTGEEGHALGKNVMWRLIVAQCSYSHLKKQLNKSFCNHSQCFKYLMKGAM